MEILSDATFKGSALFKGYARFDDYVDFNGSIRIDQSGPTTNALYVGANVPLRGIPYPNDTSRCALHVENLIVKESSDGRNPGGSAYLERLELGECSIVIPHACNGSASVCLTPGTMATKEDISNINTKIDSFEYELNELSNSFQPKCVSSLFIEKIPIKFDVPADCTKFSIMTNHTATNENTTGAEYLVMTKGTSDSMSPVNIDLEIRCSFIDGITGWRIIATKSSGFAMNASDGYVLKVFYTTNS